MALLDGWGAGFARFFRRNLCCGAGRGGFGRFPGGGGKWPKRRAFGVRRCRWFIMRVLLLFPHISSFGTALQSWNRPARSQCIYHGTIVPGYGTIHRLMGAGLDGFPRFRGGMASRWGPYGAGDVPTWRESLGFRAVTAGFGTCGNLLPGKQLHEPPRDLGLVLCSEMHAEGRTGIRTPGESGGLRRRRPLQSAYKAPTKRVDWEAIAITRLVQSLPKASITTRLLRSSHKATPSSQGFIATSVYIPRLLAYQRLPSIPQGYPKACREPDNDGLEI